MIKKLISFVVAIVLMLSLSVPAFAATIDDFVEKAAGEVGTSFAMDPNREYYIWDESKYGKWYSDQCNWFQRLRKGSYYVHEAEWCVMFVSWCSAQVGLGIPRYIGVTEMKNWYISQGRYHDWQSYNPKKGDTVFFMREGKDSHVGIIESVEILPEFPYKDKKCIKLTVIEGDCLHHGVGWKCSSVDRVRREVRTSEPSTWNIYSSSNVIVGFGEN